MDFEAGHQMGVPIQPRVKSEGTPISKRRPKRGASSRREDSDEVQFGTSVPRVTMFNDLPPLGPGYFYSFGVTPSERESFEAYTNSLRNFPGTMRNPAGSLRSPASANLQNNLEIAKGKQPAAIEY
jgi:hypothetical protein